MAIVSGTEGFRSILADGGTTRFNDVAALGTETFVTYSFFTSWPTYGDSTRVNLGTTVYEPFTAEQLATADELTGCNGHGNPKFHERVAAELLPVVRSVTGW